MSILPTHIDFNNMPPLFEMPGIFGADGGIVNGDGVSRLLNNSESNLGVIQEPYYPTGIIDALPEPILEPFRLFSGDQPIFTSDSIGIDDNISKDDAPQPNTSSATTLFNLPLEQDPRLAEMMRIAYETGLSAPQVIALASGQPLPEDLMLPDGTPLNETTIVAELEMMMASLTNDGHEFTDIVANASQWETVLANNPDACKDILYPNGVDIINQNRELIASHAIETEEQAEQRRRMLDPDMIASLSGQFPELAEFLNIVQNIVQALEELTDESAIMEYAQEQEYAREQQVQEQEELDVQMTVSEEIQEMQIDEQGQNEGGGLYAWLKNNAENTIKSIPILGGSLLDRDESPAQTATADIGVSGILLDEGNFSLGNLSPTPIAFAPAVQQQQGNFLG